MTTPRENGDQDSNSSCGVSLRFRSRMKISHERYEEKQSSFRVLRAFRVRYQPHLSHPSPLFPSTLMESPAHITEIQTDKEHLVESVLNRPGLLESACKAILAELLRNCGLRARRQAPIRSEIRRFEADNQAGGTPEAPST